MTNKQPEALRLADELRGTPFESTRYEAAAELRRLHEVNAELVEALSVALRDLTIASDSGDFGLEFEPTVFQIQKAIAKATRGEE